MTLKQIHSMFVTGSAWQAENTYRPAANGLRNVVKRRTTQICFMNMRAEQTWMQFPKASQIVEARDGFLSFRLFTPQDVDPRVNHRSLEDTLTLTRTA